MTMESESDLSELSGAVTILVYMCAFRLSNSDVEIFLSARNTHGFTESLDTRAIASFDQ